MIAIAQRATDEPSDAAAQPVRFSHRIHADENGIPCLYCHASARLGPVAGIPSVERCAGCHTSVAKEDPEVVKVMDFWDKKTPIPWVRVHQLPEYVRFTHRRHVAAGVSCQTCHGEVERMEAAVRVNELTMGWCVSCHEERKASTDCLTCHY